MRWSGEHSPWVRIPTAASVPSRAHTSIGHRRRSRIFRSGPFHICHTLVSSAGTTRIAAAWFDVIREIFAGAHCNGRDAPIAAILQAIGKRRHATRTRPCVTKMRRAAPLLCEPIYGDERGAPCASSAMLGSSMDG